MSAHRYTVREVLCDAPNCFNTVDIVGVSIVTVRKSARADGWRCDVTGDWCPVHAGNGTDDWQVLAMSGENP